MMKKWLVPRSDDPNSMAVIGANFRPKKAILEAPIDQLTGEYEEAQWLTIQEVEQEDGTFKKMAVVDQSLKAQIISERQAADQSQADAKAARDAEIARLFQRADNFDKQQLVSLKEVQDAIGDIVEVLKLMNGVK